MAKRTVRGEVPCGWLFLEPRTAARSHQALTSNDQARLGILKKRKRMRERKKRKEKEVHDIKLRCGVAYKKFVAHKFGINWMYGKS